MSERMPEQIVPLLKALLEENLQPEQHQELTTILQQSREARRLFVDYVGLHSTLQWQAIELSDVNSEKLAETPCSLPTPLADDIFPFSQITTSQRSLKRIVPIALAVSCLFLVATVWLVSIFFVPPQHELTVTKKALPNPSAEKEKVFVGVLTKSEDARWSKESKSYQEGQLLPNEKLALLSGQVWIDLFGGGSLQANGPAEFVLKSDDSLKVNFGTVVVKVTDENSKLRVKTPAAEFLHIGTEFAVSVWDDGTSDLSVLDGAVEVHPFSSESKYGSSQLVRAGGGFRISKEGRFDTLPEDIYWTRQASVLPTSHPMRTVTPPMLSAEGFEVRYVKVDPNENVALLELELADDLLAGRFSKIEDTTTKGVPLLDFEEHGDVPGSDNLFPYDEPFPGDAEAIADLDDGFAIRATGTVLVDRTWIYSLLTNSDDGVRVRIDGQDVIVDDGYHRPTISIGSIPLSKGKHMIEVTYYNLHRGSRLEVGVGVGRIQDVTKFVPLTSSASLLQSHFSNLP